MNCPDDESAYMNQRPFLTTEHVPCELVHVLVETLVQVRHLHDGTLHYAYLEDLRAEGGQPALDAALTRCSGVYGEE